MNYRIFNRKTNREEPEVSGNLGGLNFLYQTLPGKMIMPFFIRPLISRLYGRYVKSRRSAGKINSFIEQYQIDLSEINQPLTGFTSLNGFFIRQLKPEARRIASGAGILISPADSRLLAFNMSRQNSLPVKGYWYSLQEFVQDEALAAEFADGWCFIYRLAPCDYHRFCFIDNCRQEPVRKIRGVLHSVNPIALSSVNTLLSRNYRELTVLHTENFGKVLHFEVGALMVGKIIQHEHKSASFTKGDEKGWFEFGGSTIVQIFKKNIVKPDADILEHTENHIETMVKMGEQVGIRDNISL